jgi:hypothetical protein
MLTGQEFAKTIFESLDARIAQAGGSQPGPELSAADVDKATLALRDAAQRLKDNPSLLSGDPDGVFTFEDPVLAVAALWSRQADELYNSLVVSAGSEGDDLKSGLRWSWMLTGVHAFLSRGDHNKVILGGRVPIAPLETKKENLRVAVVGDAGYKGVAQDTVISLLLARHAANPFDFVIHLGDVYFSGGVEEMTRNFLNPFSRINSAGARLFTLLGNHDLYYGGEGYLFALNLLAQPGRYFLLTNPHWRIACLDTSLGAAKILGNDAKLDEGQLRWFEALLQADDPRKLILMSHHFLLRLGKPRDIAERSIPSNP